MIEKKIDNQLIKNHHLWGRSLNNEKKFLELHKPRFQKYFK